MSWRELLCYDVLCMPKPSTPFKHLYEKSRKELDGCKREATKHELSARHLQNVIDQISLEHEELKDAYDELYKNSKPAFKYPEKHITYGRYFLKADGSVGVGFTNIDVRLFIQKNDYLIQKEVGNAGLVYKGDAIEELDYLIPALYKLAKKGYNYKFDSQFGFGELWLFPFELRTLRENNTGGDCEDWSHMIGSYFAAANIPRDKWLVSCGTTRNGQGHSTVYAQDSQGDWRHLNSTRPSYKHEDLKEFPHKDSPTDVIGIDANSFWFSFNDLISVSKFKTTAAKKGFNEHLKNKVEIKEQR